MYTINIDFN